MIIIGRHADIKAERVTEVAYETFTGKSCSHMLMVGLTFSHAQKLILGRLGHPPVPCDLHRLAPALQSWLCRDTFGCSDSLHMMLADQRPCQGIYDSQWLLIRLVAQLLE